MYLETIVDSILFAIWHLLVEKCYNMFNLAN